QEKIDSGTTRQGPAMEQHRRERDSHTVAESNIGRVQYAAEPPVVFGSMHLFRIDGHAKCAPVRGDATANQLERIFGGIKDAHWYSEDRKRVRNVLCHEDLRWI